MKISKRLALKLLEELENKERQIDEEWGQGRPRWKLVDQSEMSFAYYELLKLAGVNVDARIKRLKKEGL